MQFQQNSSAFSPQRNKVVNSKLCLQNSTTPDGHEFSMNFLQTWSPSRTYLNRVFSGFFLRPI